MCSVYSVARRARSQITLAAAGRTGARSDGWPLWLWLHERRAFFVVARSSSSRCVEIKQAQRRRLRAFDSALLSQRTRDFRASSEDARWEKCRWPHRSRCSRTLRSTLGGKSAATVSPASAPWATTRPAAAAPAATHCRSRRPRTSRGELNVFFFSLRLISSKMQNFCVTGAWKGVNTAAAKQTRQHAPALARTLLAFFVTPLPFYVKNFNKANFGRGNFELRFGVKLKFLHSYIAF